MRKKDTPPSPPSKAVVCPTTPPPKTRHNGKKREQLPKNEEREGRKKGRREQKRKMDHIVHDVSDAMSYTSATGNAEGAVHDVEHHHYVDAAGRAVLGGVEGYFGDW